MDQGHGPALPRATALDVFPESTLRLFRERPDIYAAIRLGREPWEKPRGANTHSQAEILRALPHHRQIAVKSGNKDGKTSLMAIAMIWAWDMFPGTFVPVAAPTYRQVEIGSWREVHNLVDNAPLPFITKPNQQPSSGWRNPKTGSYMRGISPDKVETAQGFTGSDIYIFGDEASGIHRKIFRGFQGQMASLRARALYAGNPTQVTGHFHDLFGKRIPGLRRFTMRSDEVALKVNAQDQYPGLASPVWLEEMRALYGEDSPEWQIHVLGEFPSEGSMQVVPLAVSLAAQEPNQHEPAERFMVGLDVARDPAGDRSVLIIRDGNRFVSVESQKGADGERTAEWCLGHVVEFVDGRRTDIMPDEVGIGASVTDNMQRIVKDRGLSHIRIVPVNVGRKSTEPLRYPRLRDELWFKYTNWLKNGGSYHGVKHKDELHEETIAPMYKYDDSQRRKVASKDQIRLTLGRSPDYADAGCLTLYQEKPGYAEALRSAKLDFL